ncbi:MAG TPA: polyprenyl synthetase family protein [Coxiellaceae bacterium]|nr:polyprenyl synthetase family protein [Coxiellaceae bacterium]
MNTDILDMTPSLDIIRQSVRMELEATDQLIQTQLFSEVPLIKNIVQHIIQSGGKRIRPLIVLLLAKALNYEGEENIELATVIEFIHTATLLHDDVVDESLLRRGRQTANAIWDNKASVLAGDFLYSRAFQLLAKRSNVPVTKLLAETTNAIAEGELWQLMNRDDANLTEEHYFKVIHYKTAKLFAAAAAIGAMIASDNTAIRQAAYNYGKHLGIAFQLIDDLLDYTSDAETLGKNIGDDLADGKMTLPLIYALQQSDTNTTERIKSAFKNHNLQELELIKTVIANTNAIHYTQQKAWEHIQMANVSLQALPSSTVLEALQELTHFTLTRQS